MTLKNSLFFSVLILETAGMVCIGSSINVLRNVDIREGEHKRSACTEICFIAINEHYLENVYLRKADSHYLGKHP